jgi:hypothetical protein
VAVGDVYGGWRVVQWLSTSVAGWVVNEKFALWLSVGYVAIVGGFVGKV